ncbi:MAG TPA: hypothetical protein VJN21_03920 [Candidatus Acidoferrales bacterium]|nr:hypothetical protein [Candidatus Acidoferrales bacterium]
MKLFSYVVEHDDGHAPNPYFGTCTLCRCKYRKHPGGRRNVVELAKEAHERGEIVWVVGTGGADLRKSAGNGKLVYAMRVDEVLSRSKYYKDPRFAEKKPLASGSYKEQQGDNVPPHGEFERDEQYVLVSRHFYYFGKNAPDIPPVFPNLEKKGRGFRSRFEDTYIDRFVRWIETDKAGSRGEPCGKPSGTGACLAATKWHVEPSRRRCIGRKSRQRRKACESSC